MVHRLALFLLGLILIVDSTAPNEWSKFRARPNAWPKASNSSHYFLQITDIHMDKFYAAGSDVLNFCHFHGAIPFHQTGVSKFGNRYCDNPPITVSSAFDFVRKLHETYPIDFVAWTGDSVRHTRDPYVPVTIEGDVIDTIQFMTNLINTSLPGVHAFPSIGNNDCIPHDVVLPGPNPLLSNLTLIWSPWLSNSAHATMLQGGYYTMKIQKNGNVRMVSLNTIYWYSNNPTTTPDECSTSGTPGWLQMTWFESVMTDAAISGENVIIIGHVPPQAYWDSCARSFSAIAFKYATSIKALLFGHTHSDQISLLEDPESGVPFAATFIAPSVVPTFNPSLRLYEYDQNSGSLINYHQFYASLDEAIIGDAWNWQLEYSFVEAYGLKTLSLRSVTELIHRIQIDPATANMYNNFQFVSMPQHPKRSEEIDPVYRKRLQPIEKAL